MCELVLRESGLLPHVNPGVMTRDEIATLRTVSISQGIMLESSSERLCLPGEVHHGSPDKKPSVRLETIRLAGELQVPFTTGLLIGIGESRDERVDSLLALRDLQLRYGHIQEIIVQNFRAKPDTKLAQSREPDRTELMWTIAMARLIFGPSMNIQAPPNLSPIEYPHLIAAGINDWGGISPVTPDHVNPEAPWPEIETLRAHTEFAGKILVERLAAYPSYCRAAATWQDPGLVSRVLRAIDADGFARSETWSAGAVTQLPRGYVFPARAPSEVSVPIALALAKVADGEPLPEEDIVTLFGARGHDFSAVCAAANELRKKVSGEVVRYVVNRNINYTNVCYFKCQFCAFSKGKFSENLRGAPYDLALEEVARRATEAWQRGASEVCMQGGIHPDYTGETYLDLCRAVKASVPGMHVHAFSPLEVAHGARTLGISTREFLVALAKAGLGTLPGTAAEILDDEIRARLCPDKLSTDEWLEVIATAHEVGFRTTATIMFGHIEQPPHHWARHLLHIRALQAHSGGFTEFVPLPFIHMEAPLYLKGKARSGPTFRETILMHAVARLVLHPLITNVQVSWVKLGEQGAQACLNAGANDLGGTLTNESISRAAGTEHGQELPPEKMDALIRAIGRIPQQRTTLYEDVPEDKSRLSYGASPVQPMVLTSARKYARNAATGVRARAPQPF